MDNTSTGSEAASQGTGAPASAISAALESAATAPSAAYPIRPPRTWAELSEGVWLPGRSHPGGDIPERWIPPEFTDLLEYGESSGKSHEAGS
jgi:hypothetical protein